MQVILIIIFSWDKLLVIALCVEVEIDLSLSLFGFHEPKGESCVYDSSSILL